MQVFMSWSGVRSKAVADALCRWLPLWVPEVRIFHSESIEKGTNWHKVLIENLRACRLGIFCVTPEAVGSPWLLFEAGAMAQHGDQPTLLTYKYGIEQLTGPLAHFQATRFDRADTGKMVEAVEARAGSAGALDRFEQGWAEFQADVTASTRVPAQQLIPGFDALFERSKKTFHEPFPECSNRRWDDRLRRTARTHGYLSQPEISALVESDPFLRQGYTALLAALDRYDMHLGAHLLEPRPYDGLDETKQRELEDARKLVLDFVTTLQRRWPAPIIPEAPGFETQLAADLRKEAIHDVEYRLKRGDVSPDPLKQQRLQWALDRIAYYLAAGAGLLPEAGIEQIVTALETEEANARTRSLVSGLQPLYYAAECLDEMLTAPPDARLAARIGEAIDSVHRFVDAHPGRDSDGHIARRLASIRRKLTPAPGAGGP